MIAEQGMDRTIQSSWMIGLATVLGLGVYLYPFVLPTISQGGESSARSGEAPIVLCALVVLCLGAILRELDPMRSGEGASRIVALLASLVAIGAISRLIPSFLGASPIFLLVMLGGYVFGASFGFQLGALTLAVSAFLTGGIGPWLPYQMLGLGWVGLVAGALPRPGRRGAQIAILAGYGVVSGFLFGALLNLWFWPFAAPGGEVAPGLSWSPDLGLGEALRRYGQFYVVTSLWFDLFRAIGNGVLIVVLGRPILRTLERYRDRFRFRWQHWDRVAEIPATDRQTA
jgi:energy-coupling factor transport system substrate-specific component